ncbi:MULTISPECIES: beta-glucoside-specific PTS transporter subunit IIABC [unclassified Paenibacillus]|uniref:beta-glucoside-specific PTS transporter subunit IIABC n=1 Tax=unclassified Paenibacillus TaxID=185978 RepID=UPI002406AC0F|nr:MULTISPECIES: beta-glucoside-specific PTS transporter subunit IIABC [unclassified Paenibacillus]MDF9844770.1 PTS system beta-glucosides-specific IIC component [Paenibacillus sp. PastF-2]MDF9851372.1 PTS system beta-glucosides-specific IIC component [Paenibacillus sp. PastM-2]MDF9857954.1 PTS system beta-glucosides-specific IIC component [Paenibacillus sp. PastF-1]MDH6483222.1 PTS system beta-glucosides-specific IIC component [Paenibacillus sp. PastH-2]MDH6510632.1 PTS system beta-glucosides
MDFNKLAKDILQLTGGKENIVHLEHCMTRIRMNVKDDSKVQTEQLKSLDGVMGVAQSGGQHQIIIGNNVTKVYKELVGVGHLESANSEDADEQTEKNSWISKVFDIISGIFVPIIPVIAGAGMLKGLLSILTTTEAITTTSDAYKFIEALSSAAFIFLPILLAFSSATKFKTNPYVAVVLGGFMLHPAFTALRQQEITSLDVFNLPVRLIDYSSSVLPIILAVWMLSYIEKIARKIIPGSLRIVLEAMLILLVAAPITMTVIGPLGTVIGDGLSDVFNIIFNFSGLLAGVLLGGTFSLIVITGMHYGFTPLILGGIAKNGFDLIKPMMMMANMGQAGATFAVFLKTKNKKMKSLAGASTFSALLGITEPAIYGVTMKLKRPFIGALIGGAAGGGIAGVFKVKAYGWAVAGLPAIPLFLGNTFIYFIIAVLVSFSVGMLATLLLGFKDIEEEKQIEQAQKSTDAVMGAKGEVIQSPLEGEVIPIQNLSDPAFAEEMMGKGVAIEPSAGSAVSPVDGVIMHITKSKHAIAIVSDAGAEVLIHIGIDTVKLKGEHFISHVKAGDHVTVGQLLIEFDIPKIKDAGYQTVTAILVTNPDRYQEPGRALPGPIVFGEQLMTLEMK